MIETIVQEKVTVKRKSKKRFRTKLTPFLFLAPALLINILVVAGPTIGTLWFSFTNWDGFSSPKFIGIKNYITLIHDPNFYAALSNNLRWMIIFCTVPLILGLIVAVVVSKVKNGKVQMLYRSTFFLPYIISTVVTAKIWDWIFDPFFGINKVLSNWGIKGLPMWLGNPKIALYSVAFVNCWQFWGFVMVLFLTALLQNDKSIEESARVEGANKFQIFWHITLPQLRPTIVLVLMLTMIFSFGAFDYVYIMTNGGPGNATEVIGTYMYKEALQNQEPGYASTIALAMALLSGIVIALFGFLKKKGWDV